MSKREIRVDESYVSFKNIDCYENACVVIDNLLRVLETPANRNAYWDKVVSKIPQGYYTRSNKDDKEEYLLYLVCSNAFYLIEFFEDLEDEEAIHSLELCEQECC